MAGEPEESAGQSRIGALNPAKRPGQQHEQHLGGKAHGGDGPHRERHQRHENAQGGPIVWIFRMPGIIRAIEIERDQPGGCHH
jgi:hypothetical protein